MGLKNTKAKGVIDNTEHSHSSLAKRTTEVGIVIGKNILTQADGIEEDISTAVLIGKNRHVLITNTSSSVLYYVGFGASNVSAPDNTSGIPIPPYAQIRLCSGVHEYIRASNAAIHCVEIED